MLSTGLYETSKSSNPSKYDSSAHVFEWKSYLLSILIVLALKGIIGSSFFFLVEIMNF